LSGHASIPNINAGMHLVIYIAQDREEAANALDNCYKWKRNVLSLFLNVASVMSGVRSSAGRLFHTTPGLMPVFQFYLGDNLLGNISRVLSD